MIFLFLLLSEMNELVAIEVAHTHSTFSIVNFYDSNFGLGWNLVTGEKKKMIINFIWLNVKLWRLKSVNNNNNIHTHTHAQTWCRFNTPTEYACDEELNTINSNALCGTAPLYTCQQTCLSSSIATNSITGI